MLRRTGSRAKTDEFFQWVTGNQRQRPFICTFSIWLKRWKHQRMKNVLKNQVLWFVCTLFLCVWRVKHRRCTTLQHHTLVCSCTASHWEIFLFQEKLCFVEMNNLRHHILHWPLFPIVQAYANHCSKVHYCAVSVRCAEICIAVECVHARSFYGNEFQMYADKSQNGFQ